VLAGVHLSTEESSSGGHGRLSVWGRQKMVAAAEHVATRCECVGQIMLAGVRRPIGESSSRSGGGEVERVGRQEEGGGSSLHNLEKGSPLKSFRALGQNVGANVFAPRGPARLSTYSWLGLVTERRSDAYTTRRTPICGAPFLGFVAHLACATHMKP
jgi:hypothetical protein